MAYQPLAQKMAGKMKEIWLSTFFVCAQCNTNIYELDVCNSSGRSVCTILLVVSDIMSALLHTVILLREHFKNFQNCFC